MKCNYDLDFIQNYNDGNLSNREKQEFEIHIKTCSKCENIVSRDMAVINCIKSDIPIGAIPTEKIMARLDLDRYHFRMGKYRFINFVGKIMPKARVAIPAAVVILSVVFLLVNPVTSDFILNGISDVFNKEQRTSSMGLNELALNEIDKSTINTTDKELVNVLNAHGMGVGPWEIVYADKDKVFFKNYASLVKYKDGHIYRAANLDDLNATSVQGSVVSQFNFSPDGNYVVVGNGNYEMLEGEEFGTDTYILDTDTGKYFSVGKENYANVADAWSFNGNYYVHGKKDGQSQIILFDAERKKLYEMRAPGVKINKIFVTDEGAASFYSDSDRCIYFFNMENGEIKKKIPVSFQPLYVSADEKKAVWVENDNKIHLADLDGENIKSEIINDTGNIKVGEDYVVKNNRFLVFHCLGNGTDKNLGVFDLKDKSIETFRISKVLPEDILWRLRVSPNGKSIFFDSGDIYYIGSGNEGTLKLESYLASGIAWMDDEKIAIIDLMQPTNGGEAINSLKAGEFKISAFNITENKDQLIYTSVK